MIFERNGIATDLYTISEELVHGLPSELSDPYAANTPWTKAVKARLYAIGNARGLKTYCHGSKHGGEWLLDVVWMVPNEHHIVLAAESEWGILPHVEDDFDKLMSIKAPCKLLLFNTNNHNDADIIINKLQSNMLAYPYHIAGEEYMLLEVTASGAFRYYFKVLKDGRQDDATFDSSNPPLP